MLTRASVTRHDVWLFSTSGGRCAVHHWKLYEIDTPDGSRSPVVLHSVDRESRVVLVALDPGQELGMHQVKEAAFLLILAPWPGDGHYRGDQRAGAAAS